MHTVTILHAHLFAQKLTQPVQASVSGWLFWFPHLLIACGLSCQYSIFVYLRPSGECYIYQCEMLLSSASTVARGEGWRVGYTIRPELASSTGYYALYTVVGKGAANAVIIYYIILYFIILYYIILYYIISVRHIRPNIR